MSGTNREEHRPWRASNDGRGRRRHHHGTRILGVVLQQAIVENLPRHRIEPTVGLIEEG